MEDIRLNFTGFWTGFDVNNNLFKSVIEDVLGLKVRVVGKSKKSDLEVTSVFHMNSVLDRGSKFLYSKVNKGFEAKFENASRYGFVAREKSTGNKRIWYSGENYRTPYGCADGYIGFDKSDLAQNVVYFPHWMYRLYSRKNALKGSQESYFQYLSKYREPIERENNCCIFSSSLDPRRKFIIDIVKNYLDVKTYGKAFGNFVESKSEIAKDFGFQICPENSLYPGYVTEKLIESWEIGNIPIWEGLDSEEYFNRGAYIDLTNCTTMEITEIMDSMREMNLTEIRSKPILQKVPDISPVINMIKKVLG